MTQAAPTTEIDAMIDEAFAPLSGAVSDFLFYKVPFMGQDVSLLLVWLAAASVFFTLYLGFINLRGFGHAWALLGGKYNKQQSADGQISPFQALATSLSGTVGLGNIAGVAVAVSIGGPGAVFWMMIMGILGMSTKFAEVALAVKYRAPQDPNHPDRVSGGPMYYLKVAFEKFGMGGVGKVIALIFALFVIGGAIGGGNMFQSNQAYIQTMNVFGGSEGWLGGKGWMFGLFLAFLVGLVIIGGLKSIAHAASVIVPVMGILYLLGGLVVIGLHIEALPGALVEIVRLAFAPESAYGGLLGGLLVGVQRASFSNEAGLGSAAIVHAATRTDKPIKQGFVGMLGPFIDTVVICMVTALMIVVTGVYEGADSNVEGVSLTSRAMADGVSWFPYLLAATVFLFAYSTLITWSYYGLKGATYIFGEKKAVEICFKVIFLLFVVLGASAELGNVIGFSDAMILAMGIPNIIGLYLLAPEIRADLKAYWATRNEKS